MRTTTAEKLPSPIIMDTPTTPTSPDVSIFSQQQPVNQQQQAVLQLLPLPRNVNKLLKCVAKL